MADKEVRIKFIGSIENFTQKAQEVVNITKKVNDNAKKSTTKTTDSINKSIEKITNTNKKVSDSFKSMFNNINKNSNKAVKGLEGLHRILYKMQRFGKFLMFTYIGRQLANLVARTITAGAEISEIENLFRVSFGKMSDEAEAFAMKLEKAWGVSSVKIKEQTALLNNMVKSMGIAEDVAFGLSTQAVQLSYNMASLFNKDQAEILEAIKSAYVGLSKPIRKYGVEVSVASLQEVAFRLGITSTNRELTRQEKILATHWAIYEQTRSAWESGTAIINGQKVAIGDMTKTIGSNANMLRVIKDQLGNMAYYWGLAFQPIMSYVLPLIARLNQLLIQLGKTFATFIGQLFGFSSLKDLIGEFGTADKSTTDDLTSGLSDVEGQAKKTKKAVDNLTGGIDELNILKVPEGGNGGLSGFGATGIENNIGLPEMDYIDEVLDKVINQRLEELKNKLKSIVPILSNVGKGFLGAFAVGGILSLIPNITKAMKPFVREFGLVKGIIVAVKTGLINLSSVILTLLNPITLIVAGLTAFGTGFVYLFTTSENFRNNIIGYLSEIWAKFVEVGNNIYSKFIAPLVVAFKEFISSVWDNGLSLFVEHLSYLIGEIVLLVTNLVSFFIENVLPHITAFIKGVLKVAEPVIRFILFAVDTIILVLEGLIKFLNEGFTLDWSKVWEGFKKVTFNVINSIIGFIESMINNAFTGLNNMIAFANSIANKLGFGFDVAPAIHVTLPRLPELASGGLAYGDTLARIGEYSGARSNPEVVAPLSDLTTILSETNAQNNEAIIYELREQNNLLKELLRKDTSINIDGRELAKTNSAYTKKLGYNLGIDLD